MKACVYADTSAIAGAVDEKFEEHSGRLMDTFARGELVLVLSDLTLRELKDAPEAVRRVLQAVPAECIERVSLSGESADLADAYIRAGVVGEKMRIDAQHIAVATVERVDVLVSWNFRHVVNLHRIHGYNSVNLRMGYPMLEIRTPREVLRDGQSREVL